MEPADEYHIHEADGVISTFYPDIIKLLNDDEIQKPASDWSIAKIGTLVAKIEDHQNLREGRYGLKRLKNVLPLHSLVKIANDSFGYDGWSTEVMSTELKGTMDSSKDDGSENKYCLTVVSKVRVTLKDGTYLEAVGLGKADQLSSKSMAYNKGKKESVTDGTKKAIYGLKGLILDYETRVKSGYYVGDDNIFK